MSYGPIDYGKLEKVLEKELRGQQLQFVKFIEFPVYRPFAERGAPWLQSDVFDVCWTNRDTIVVVDSAGHVIREVDLDGRVLWEYGTFGTPGPLNWPGACDYKPKTDTVIVADVGNKRVIEIDLETRKIVNELREVEGVPLDPLRGVCYGEEDDVFYILLGHACIKTNWAGEILWQFGEIGTPGSDDSHLNLSAGGYVQMEARRRVVVCDTMNHRILCLAGWSTPRIYSRIMLPFPKAVKVGKGTWELAGVTMETAYAFENLSFVLSNIAFPGDRYGADVVAVLPFGSNTLAISHGRELMVAGAYYTSVWYAPLVRIAKLTLPRSIILRWSTDPVAADTLTSIDLAAGATAYSMPVPLFPFTTRTFYVYSTQDATVDVEVSLTHRHGLAHEGWYTYYSARVSAGRLLTITIDEEVFIARLKVTMGATAGTVKGWFYGGVS